MKQIFPKEIIENSTEVHQFEHRTRSKVIYSTLLIAIIIAFIALPLIKVNVYTSARGILKPSKERASITNIITGKVIYAKLKDNQKVSKGDTLLLMDRSSLNNKQLLSKNQMDDITGFITDLEYLLHTKNTRFSKIKTARYQHEFSNFLQKQKELNTRFQKSKQVHDRNSILFSKEVIARAEHEDTAFEYELAKSAVQQNRQQQHNTWQAALTGNRSDLVKLESQVDLFNEDQKQLVIIAPISGVLKNTKGITAGSFLVSGAVVAEISPDTNLIAECYLSPSDIGMMKNNNDVNFQVDAFNYNQWGLATGHVNEISKDVDILDNKPVFTVKCIVDQTYLALSNGFQGELKKGMTFNARFLLTERTLFELLYDKVDDWLNPSSSLIAEK